MTRDVLSRPARPPDLTVGYGPRPDHLADVRLPPTGGPAPLLVVVHGGFWSAEWDRAHAGPQSEGLAEAGFVVATVEYHRAGMPGGGWPGTFDDLAAVADHVPGLVAAAAPGRVAADVAPVLVGHSAGGHLALWAASRHRLPTSRWHRPTPVPRRGRAARRHGGPGRRRGAGSRRPRGTGAARRRAGRGAGPVRRGEPGAAAAAGGPDGVGARDGRPGGPGRMQPDVRPGCGRGRRRRGAARARGVGHFELVDPVSAAWPSVLAAVRRLSG